MSTERIFTLGYQTLDISSFLELLRKNQVDILCDVRANPISRKKGFSKKALSNHLKEEKISYQHFGELGIPSKDRRTQSKKELFSEYEQRLKKNPSLIKEILELIQEKWIIALTCFELDKDLCHRTVLVQHIQNHLDTKNIEVEHL